MSTERKRTMEEIMNQTIKGLRKSNLEKGFSFLGYLDSLPASQGIYEFPEGTFRIMELVQIEEPLRFVRMATPEEIVTLKEENPAYEN